MDSDFFQALTAAALLVLAVWLLWPLRLRPPAPLATRVTRETLIASVSQLNRELERDRRQAEAMSLRHDRLDAAYMRELRGALRDIRQAEAEGVDMNRLSTNLRAMVARHNAVGTSPTTVVDLDAATTGVVTTRADDSLAELLADEEDRLTNIDRFDSLSPHARWNS